MKDKHSDHTVKITSSDLGGEKECREGRFTSKQSRSVGMRLQERHYELHVYTRVSRFSGVRKLLLSFLAAQDPNWATLGFQCPSL